METKDIFRLIFTFLAIAAYFFFIRREKSKPQRKALRYEAIEELLNRLVTNKLEHNSIGITSDGIDCIYFVDTSRKINIEFEVMTLAQKEYVRKLRTFAKDNQIELEITTNGNKPKYDDRNEAPVYRLKINSDIKEAAEIGAKILRTVFGKDELTEFETVL